MPIPPSHWVCWRYIISVRECSSKPMLAITIVSVVVICFWDEPVVRTEVKMRTFRNVREITTLRTNRIVFRE
jgi:hypothetical protein